MIATVGKARGYTSEHDAIEYMLTVATGRLTALGRYEKSLPEGKSSKGVLARKKKSAPRSKSPWPYKSRQGITPQSLKGK
jgi:hypothetical protein